MADPAAASAWRAMPDDADDVARLLVAFRDHMGSDRPSATAFRASVERLLADPGCEFLLAAPRAGAPPIGVLQLRFRFSVWTVAPDAWIEDLFVAAGARRAGAGGALLRLAFARAAARGARRIELDCNEANATALALYARHGLSTRSKGGPGRDLLLGRPLDPA